MSMQPRYIPTSSINPRFNFSLVDMKPRFIPTSKITNRQSSDSSTVHLSYDQYLVHFNQDPYTYEYTSYRGILKPRIISTVQMRGR